MRIGLGYDAHRLVCGRSLILGGVDIPFEKGLLGHSDADVLVHAVMDALLGAAALGDIGKFFPDTDPIHEEADSLELLEVVREMIDAKGYYVENIDSVICAQAPLLAPYMVKMAANIADCLGVMPKQVCVKATTEEEMGFTGSGEGISARAVCLIEKKGVRFL